MASPPARIYRPGVTATPRQPSVATGLSATAAIATAAVATRAVTSV